jgi:hypothetical protein
MFKRRTGPAVLATGFVIVTCAFGQEIHLKRRTIATSSQAGTPQPDANPNVRQAEGVAHTVHQIVEFSHPLGPADVEALMAAGARVTGILPDDAAMIAITGGLRTLPAGAIWVGAMDPKDKISPALQAGDTAAPVIVEFHSDVDVAAQAALEASLFGTTQSATFLRPAGLAPQHAIVLATVGDLAALAGAEEVAYVFPADPAMLSGAGIYSCAGMLTGSGSVAQYSNTVHGWDMDSDNIAHLTYYFGTLTPKVPAAVVQSEIQRALNEWASHVNVAFSQAAVAGVARSISVSFASGSHGDAYSFDGPGGMLAHAFYPVPVNAEPLAGDMHFDADEFWKAGADTDIYTVALHEIGHAIGLSHSDNPGDVMYPYYHRGVPLSANDIGAARQLYPAKIAAPAAPSQPVSISSTTQPGSSAPAALAMTLDSVPASTQLATVDVTAVITGGTGPYTVQWQTNHGYSGSAEQSGGSMWTACDIPLTAGSNTITITAFDAADHTATRTVTTVLQTASATPAAPAAPIAISISAPATAVVNVTSSTISVSGKASGGAGITKVTWQTSNGATGVATGVAAFVASNIPVLQGTTTVVLRAFDAKGANNWVAVVAVHP